MNKRLDELLVREATQKLTPAETAELDALLAAHPDEDPESLERAAAAIHRALLGPLAPLPASLAAELQRTAAAFLPEPPTPPAPKRRAPLGAWVGWVAAACLAGVLVYMNFANAPKKPPTIEEARAALLSDPAAKPAPFAGKNDKTAVTGDVVWSTEKQEGYLEVRGLPPLDPTKEQYQLWIVDPSKKQPVDGGVFDVKPDGTVLVRIRAPIKVKEAKLFAVTKEPAGGVVVSEDGQVGNFALVLTPKPG